MGPKIQEIGRQNMLIVVKYREFATIFGGLQLEMEEKFWSGKWKAVPLRADYYQSNSLLGQCCVEFGRSARCCLGN